jgi:hypothetical protein
MLHPGGKGQIPMVVGGFNEMLGSYILLFLAELALPIQRSQVRIPATQNRFD